MTSDNELRDRIAERIWQNTMVTTEGSRQIAQAIIDELGLTVELRADRVMPSPDPLEFDCIQRVVGKWEKQ